MSGRWLVLPKVTFLVTGLLQSGHGEGVQVSSTEEGMRDPCLSLARSYVLFILRHV